MAAAVAGADPRPGENRSADTREALGIAQREADVATAAAGSAERAEREAKAAWDDERATARQASRAPVDAIELAFKDAFASSSRADASAKTALSAAADAAQDVLLFGPCGGLLDELATSVSFEEQRRCAETS